VADIQPLHHVAALGIDADDLIGAADADPDIAERGNHAARLHPDVDLVLAALIDPRDGVGVGVRHPLRSIRNRDPLRVRADRDRVLGMTVLRVHSLDRAVASVRDPHTPVADRDPVGIGADRDRVRDRV
jgi:hypothetical protein